MGLIRTLANLFGYVEAEFGRALVEANRCGVVERLVSSTFEVEQDGHFLAAGTFVIATACGSYEPKDRGDCERAEHFLALQHCSPLLG